MIVLSHFASRKSRSMAGNQGVPAGSIKIRAFDW
jgi:hypothetical protein